METNVASDRKVKRISWGEIAGRACELPKHVYYGIPRGGSFVAGIMETHGYQTTDRPESASAFVDDIVDSGATKEKWKEKFPLVPFFSLFEREEWH